ncbi:MAG: hypothetical protein ACON3Z_18095 [Bradymonadia bacterium]
MRNRIIATIALVTMLAGSASALPFVDMGIKLGYGNLSPSHDDSDVQKALDEVDVGLFAAGVAARIQVLMVQVEANALYWSESYDSEASYSALSLPIIARLDFAPIPLLKLAAGTGLEFQFPLAAKGPSGDDAMDQLQSSTYLPLSASADLTLPALGTIGLEARYGYELSSRLKDDQGVSNNYFMFMGTFLF